MKTITLTLGGEEYVISELPRKQNVAWRQKLEEELTPLLALVERANDTELSDVESVTSILTGAKRIIMDSPDTVLALLMDYSPVLTEDAERIEEEAYESEIIDSFLSVLRLAFPFFSLGQTLTRMASNGTAQAPNGKTSKSSSLPLTGSGQKT